MTTPASEDFARPQGEGRGRSILFLGLLLGAVAAGLVALILSGRDDGEVPQVLVPSTRVAVAAAVDIPARTRITPAMLEVQTYDIADIDPDAFTAISQINNRVTAVDITAGEVIVPSLVSTTAGEGLTFSVSEGMRAVSIRVSEVVTAGGNLSPGNHVDIIGFFRIIEGTDISALIAEFTGQSPPQNLLATAEVSLTFTLLQNVRVLAVAQDLSPEVREPSAGSSSNNGAVAETETARANPRAATVTLEVTPQQAQVMASADLLGTLRLSLRPFGDNEQVEVTPIILYLE
jgi:pilus assembly protein CpaB